MKNINFKKMLPHIVAVVSFVLMSVVYMAPAAFENKDLPQNDVASGRMSSKDLRDYHEQTGEFAYWTNGMFGGMPANMTYAPQTTNIFRPVARWIRLKMPTYHLGLIFLYAIGFYILMLAMGCNPWLSIVGAIAYTFASYNIIIIEAGHVNKALVMATMAPVIAGVILTYKQKYFAGALVTLVFVGLNVYWAHQQISYYLLMMLIILAGVYFVYAVRQKTVKQFFISSAVLGGVAILSVLPSTGTLLPTYDYSKDTMRGGAILKTQKADNQKKKSGLDIDYAFQWSYGVAESMTLLIPDFYGGSSNYNIGNKSECYNVLRQSGQAKQFCANAPTYWGTQSFTSGPVYMGAIVCFLFVLGLIVVKTADRWWLLLATILSLMLSWGSNFMAFNEFMFNTLPLFNKFRTPSMALVIAEVTMAALGMLAVKEFLAAENRKQFVKPMCIAAGITGGLCLLFATIGGAFCSFSSPIDSNFPGWLVSSLEADRANMLRSDSFRSFVFIALAFALMLMHVNNKLKTNVLIAGLGALILLDLWMVDKRFLNDADFVPKKTAKVVKPTSADLLIMKDTDPDYRVLNLTVSTFNDATTSFFHKSVGGYSAAKLQRYQDIIDRHLSGGINLNVLNMLNTRYVITRGQDGQPAVNQNPEALGNAWFVNEIVWVDSPDQEIAALDEFNPQTTAFIDRCWADKLPNVAQLQHDSDSATIVLTEYVNPGNLIYQSKNNKDQLAVFSEVYYKTWKAYIDGQETPIVRVNYILRGLPIPAGQHKIEFKCVDEVYILSNKISTCSSWIVGIVALGLVVALVLKKRKEETIVAE